MISSLAPPCTYEKFLANYAANQTADPNPMAVQLLNALAQDHPNADATKYLLKHACSPHGRVLMSDEAATLSKFCEAAIKMVSQYQPDTVLPFDKNSLKTALLAIMQSQGMQQNVHFTKPPGSSLVTGSGVMLTPLGKHVALTQGLGQAWQPLNVAYTTIANPSNNFYREMQKIFIEYKEDWMVARGKSVRAFKDQKEAIESKIELAEVPGNTMEDKKKQAGHIARCATMRHDKKLYESFILQDDTPGGMTGQAARFNGYEPNAPGWKAGINKTKNQGTCASKLTKHKQIKLAASRADIEDLILQHPDVPPKQIAALVTEYAIDHGTNLSKVIVDNELVVLPPNAQRGKLFGHASHLPPLAELLAPPAVAQALPAPAVQ